MKPLEQLCIKKGILKELECIHCKGYDLNCLNYEEIPREFDNPLAEEHHVEQHKYMTEEE